MNWLGTLALNGPLLVGANLLARDAFDQRSGPGRWLATAVLAWAWATVGMIVLGSWGALSLFPLVSWSLAGLGIGVLVRWRLGGGAERDSPDTLERWTWIEAITLALILAPCLILGLRSLLGPVRVVSDGPIYHLYFAVRWWKAATLFLVPVPFGENAATYFPANGDLWFTWLLVGWGGDRLAKVGQAPFLLLAGIAAWGMARRLGASRSAAMVAVGCFLTSTPTLMFTFEPNVDTIFAAGYLVAAYFLVAYGLDGPDARVLVLCGLAAGAAWGTKPTGTLFIPPLLIIAGAVILTRQLRWRTRLIQLSCLGIAVVVMVGFWFCRNTLLTGNPLYPLDVPVFRWVGWYGSDVMTRSQFYLPRSDWRALGDILFSVLDPRLTPLWVGAVVGLWAIGGKRRPFDRWVWLFALLAVGNIVLYWVFVPYRTQQRFFFHALGLASVPLARLLDRSRILKLIGFSLLCLHVLSPQAWPWPSSHGGPPWDLSEHVPNDIGSPLLLPLGVWSIGLLVGCVCPVVGWLREIARPSSSRLIAAALPTLAMIGIGVLIAGELNGTTAHADAFYPDFGDFFRGWQELEQRCGKLGCRVAYAGTNLPLYLFGKDYRNDVRYINVDGHPDWLLHDYHRRSIHEGSPHWEAYPRPGWDRSRPDHAAWLTNLHAAGTQLLVVTRVNVFEGPHNIADRAGFPIERIWADRDPAHFELLYGARDPWFRLYRVRGESEKNLKSSTDPLSVPHR